MKPPILWTLLIWIISALGFILMMPSEYPAIAFACCTCITFVGCMPLINGDHILHWVCGISGCLLSQLWVGLINWLILGWWILYICLLPFYYKKWCLILEIGCLLSVILCKIC